MLVLIQRQYLRSRGQKYHGRMSNIVDSNRTEFNFLKNEYWEHLPIFYAYSY